MFFTDAASELDEHRLTRDGFLSASILFARSGIYQYTGHELGRPDLGAVNVFRPDTAVFDAKAMRSFAGKPVTVDHPSEDVTAANWRQHAVGHIDREIRREGNYLRANIIVQDAQAIDAIKQGRRELSAGYKSNIQWVEGTVEGQHFDAVMSDIVGNHLALVHLGRAGHQCRIGLAA